MNNILSILLVLISFGLAQTDIYDSGGPLMPEQAAYDVTFYDLSLQVSPADRSINGNVRILAHIVQPIDYFVIDLDTLLTIDRIMETGAHHGPVQRVFSREIGKVWVELNHTRQAGEKVDLQVFYHGNPRVAVRAPWDGGFSWAQTGDGSPWIATTCQGEGPDIWWPVKDHVSDEPDSMGIHIRVPDPLVCATNGRLLSVEKHDDNTSTYHWFVSTPINNYCIALNIAPYRVIEQEYTSTSGDVFPFIFWVLPEDYEKGVKIFPEFVAHLRFFEKTLGPYPFRADKYGVAQTPHLGMEHQTIIAYGANFDNGSMLSGTDWGFDALHHHELAHEWWGNLVTNTDWKDMWIHEGFGTYMQALYVETLQGMDGYHAYMAGASSFPNVDAIAPRMSVPSSIIYKAPIYAKGAWVLHTLRYLIGDDALKQSLRRMAYPDPEMEKITDGRQTRFVTTNDFIEIAERISGRELSWFFDVYVHQPFLPRLKAERKKDTLYLSWVTPDNLPFPMPLDVKIGETVQRIEIPANGTRIKIDKNKRLRINPDKWVLLEPDGLEEAMAYVDQGKYEQAEGLFKQFFFIETGNPVTKRLQKHITYAVGHPQATNGLDRFLGTYKLSENRIYDVVKEGQHYYVITRRSKYRIYPISDKQFVVREFNATYTFQFDDKNNVSALVLKNDNMRIHAEKISF